jgi:hypothetical protein
MGQKYLYKCSKCDHTLESSGKLDWGMLAVVKPYVCNRCRDVVDVLVGEHGEVIPEDKLVGSQKDEFYCCPKCNNRDLKVWNQINHPCPKCGLKMKKDNSVIVMWD